MTAEAVSIPLVFEHHDSQSRWEFCVMGAMAMDAINYAVEWMLGSMVSIYPQAKDIVKKTMSDLGLGTTPIKKALPHANMFAVCTWLIIYRFSEEKNEAHS